MNACVSGVSASEFVGWASLRPEGLQCKVRGTGLKTKLGAKYQWWAFYTALQLELCPEICNELVPIVLI